MQDVLDTLRSSTFGAATDSPLHGAVGFGTIPYGFRAPVASVLDDLGLAEVPRFELRVRVDVFGEMLEGVLLCEGLEWVAEARPLGSVFAGFAGTYEQLVALFIGDRSVADLVRSEVLFGSFGQLSYVTYLVANPDWQAWIDPYKPAARSSVAELERKLAVPS